MGGGELFPDLSHYNRYTGVLIDIIKITKNIFLLWKCLNLKDTLSAKVCSNLCMMRDPTWTLYYINFLEFWMFHEVNL